MAEIRRGGTGGDQSCGGETPELAWCCSGDGSFTATGGGASSFGGLSGRLMVLLSSGNHGAIVASMGTVVRPLGVRETVEPVVFWLTLIGCGGEMKIDESGSSTASLVGLEVG